MMMTSKLFGLTALCALAAACTPEGYYDSTGVYRVNGKAVDTYRHTPQEAVVVQEPSHVAHAYKAAGYYDRHGVFISDLNNGPRVSREYLPARSECRVWFFNRIPEEQPLPEPCNGVYGFVPANAYVIYGG